ncbi:hypothetical protein [Sphingomonas daechungensis]|uniref:hypothetical protein n=1 Tax=Sphingomonas daechungensis TaxID=1176646 RepID=UPI003783B8A5
MSLVPNSPCVPFAIGGAAQLNEQSNLEAPVDGTLRSEISRPWNKRGQRLLNCS